MDKQYLKELVGRGDLEQAFQALLGYGKDKKEKEWHNALWIRRISANCRSIQNSFALPHFGALLSSPVILLSFLMVGENAPHMRRGLCKKGSRLFWPRIKFCFSLKVRAQ